MTLPSKQANSAVIHKLLILSICCVFVVSGWSPQMRISRGIRSSLRASLTHETSPESADAQIHDTRRRFLNAAAANFFLMGATAPIVFATDAPPGTTYISGKSPLAPGETRKKSDNPKGTRKDPDFLRSVSDCKSQCQNKLGPDGLAKSKEDCLSECQDICCKTYEQCTFNIVPRI